MNQRFAVEPGAYGFRLVVNGPWNSGIGDYMRREEIRELYLNHARGWSGTDLSFLATLPDLLGFGILDFTIQDVSPVHNLSKLRSLEIGTYCETPIAFGRFPALEECVLYWRPGSDSLFARDSLKRLFLHRYTGETSGPFAKLTGLGALSIANSALSEVKSCGELRHMQFLGLYNLRRLASLAGVERLVQLEELEVNGCKSISNIDELSALIHLRKLQLNDDGKIASLKPIRSSRRLEAVLFYESTNIVDGDLSPLAVLPRLSRVAFQNRRHYSRKRESFSGMTHDGAPS